MAKKDLKRGILITFEGSEKSGKSTHVRLLCNYLCRLGFKLLHLREPGGTAIGEKIRKILLDPKNKNMDAICEMFLYQAARAQLVREKILSALRQKKIVVLDRFLDATICYQGFGAGIDIDMIKQLGYLATYGLQPNLTILLDRSIRKDIRKSKWHDRVERKSLQFHRRVRRGYLTLAQTNPRRIKVVSVDKDIAKTQAAVREIVDKKLRRIGLLREPGST